MATKKHTVVKVEDIKPGMLVYAAPGNLIVDDVLTTGESLRRQQNDKHPLVVLSVNIFAQQITVTYVTSFSNVGKLAEVKIVESAKRLLLPVAPAPKEFNLDVIDWEYHWDPEHVGCWVSIRNKKKLTAKEFKVFDQYFSGETATHINSLINTIVD